MKTHIANNYRTSVSALCRQVWVGTARCAVQCRVAAAQLGSNCGRRGPFVPPSLTRAGTSQRDVPTGKRRGASGFTLIELLLVLTILAILAAIVVPKFGGITEGAHKKAAIAQLSTFATALDMFEVDNGHYPRSLNDLVVQPRDATNWRQYMDSIPMDPWQHPYVYTFPGKHRPNSYDLMSMGPDGRAGGDDDIVNWVNTR